MNNSFWPHAGYHTSASSSFLTASLTPRISDVTKTPPLSLSLQVKLINGAHFFLEGPLTVGGCCCCCWEGPPPFSTELPRRQLCSPAEGEEESDWAASQTTWKPCGWRRRERWTDAGDKQADTS